MKLEVDPTVGDKVRTLNSGSLIQILEILDVGSRVRGRIAGGGGGWISLADAERPAMRWVEKFPLPSTYRIDVVVHVKETKALTSVHKGDVPAGTEVDVLEIAAIPDHHRVRARIAAPVAGWFSIQSVDSSEIWATRIANRAFSNMQQYCVKSTDVITSQEGVAYRFSPHIEDRLRSKDGKVVAQYGSIVSGVRYDSEWLQVGDWYLPFYIRGAPVLFELGTCTSEPSKVPATTTEPKSGAGEQRSVFRPSGVVLSSASDRVSEGSSHPLGDGTAVRFRSRLESVQASEATRRAEERRTSDTGSPVSELRDRFEARRPSTTARVDGQPGTQEVTAPSTRVPAGSPEGAAVVVPQGSAESPRRSVRAFGGTLGDSFKRLSATYDLALDDEHHAVFKRLSSQPESSGTSFQESPRQPSAFECGGLRR